MPEESDRKNPPGEEPGDNRFPELAEIQREIERRIADNRRFLERFLDENFTGEEEDGADADEGTEEPQEEL